MSNKFALPVQELKPALTGLGKVVGKRATLPVLNHIKIERTKDGWITLTSTDLDAFITYRLEQPSNGEPVSLLVPYDELLKITKNCQKTDTILVSTEKNASETSVIVEYAIGSQVAEAKLPSLPVEEFPEIPRIKGDPMPVDDALRQSIHEAMDCASTDETRFILNSAYIDVSKDDGHYVVGTNGSHLYSSNSFKLPLKESLILPTHRFLGFKEFNNDGEWALRVSTPQHKDDVLWFQLNSRRWRFIGRQMEGAFPNWRQVVPTSFESGIQFKDIEALADTIDRLPDHNDRDHTIGIEREANAVNLLWKADKAQEWKRLPVSVNQLTGNDITITLNRQYLSKALRFGLDRLDYIDPMSPIKFSRDGKQMIVMPVRTESTPPATPQAQETPSQQPAASPVAAQPERTPMVNDTTNSTEPVTIDAQFDLIIVDVEAMRTAAQDHLTEINGLRTKLKNLQREHKSSTKELQSVRQTLKGLQGLKI